ncbi:MAG TPA: DUF1501 domain-containing protein [Prosthecobacter sp.]|nr:DUF1501 domain-containing protein [Prosthecobacter sp.]HRK16273.1 DUF1501 domain-containing protein [Prosthecobacter sp.]
MNTRSTSLIPRRRLLKVGALGAGLTLSQYLRLASAGATDASTKRSGILVFLRGGPSHQDMFDLKPDASAEYRGEFNPIKTNVPGVEICEHLPKLARCADQYAIVRGLTHNLADHGLGSTYLLTGNRPGSLVKYPTYGSVASAELSVMPDLPAFVSIEEPLEGPGFLGIQHSALATGNKPRPNQPFSVRGVTLDGGLSLTQLENRQQLSRDLDTLFRGHEKLSGEITAIDEFSDKAHRILSSARARKAFDLAAEPADIAGRFGAHETGQSLLLACRLIEAGVRFVTVIVDNWDTHQQNFATLKRTLLPQFDQGLSALFTTLKDKGLLDTTAVLVTGEFGRTPKINGTAGRDHWPRAMFSLMAGGAVHGGQVLGATDATASEPTDGGWSPDDIAASFYRNIGIDPHREYHIDTGRPIQLIRNGKPIEQIFTGAA